MERRDFVTALGAAAALLSSPVCAEDKPAAPAPAGRFKTLAEAATRAGVAGKACLRYGFDRLAAKDATFAECARTTADLVAGADTLAALAGADHPYAAGFARTVADIAAACKKACDTFLNIPACKACSDACATLADECRKAAG